MIRCFSRISNIVLTRRSDNVALLSEQDMQNVENDDQLLVQLRASETQMNGFRRLSQRQEALLYSQKVLIEELHALLAKQ